MVIRTRLRTILRHVMLYLGAMAAIGYFGFHAFNGDHGIMAQRQYEDQKQALSAELASLQGERLMLEKRVALLRTDALDPDVLDEKSREMLGVVDKNDVVVLQHR
jgi:cell division protein FtsB